MELSQPVNWINKRAVGYVLNAVFSKESTEKINILIQEIQSCFGDSVFGMPKASLHITLMDWIAPLVDYGVGKDELYKSIAPEFDKTFASLTSKHEPISVIFNEIHVSPDTIYIVGHDDGEFQSIRDSFVSSVELLPGTKLPPKIIHSSLARFTSQVNLKEVESFLGDKSLFITEEIVSFRLTRSTREPMLEYEVIKEYSLRSL